MGSLECQMQATLGNIYAAPQIGTPPPRSAKKPMPQLQSVDPDLFASDDFRMYCYKIVPCSIRGPHEWTTCGFCHPGEKAQRRCPQKYSYTAIACPDLKAGECPRGQNCFFAHSVFEYWLHPTRYRTQLCSYGTECKRSICFFAHHYGELRHSDQLAQLQAIERELEGDNGMGFQVGSRWAQPGAANGPQAPKTPGRNNTMNPHQQAQQQLQRAGSQQVTPVKSFSASMANQQALLRAVSSLPSQDTLNNLHSPGPEMSNSLHTPLGSLSSHDIDSQMAAAVRLLADLSATKQQLQQQEIIQQQHVQQQQAQQQHGLIGGLSGWQASAAAALQQSGNSPAVGNPPASPLHQQYSAPVSRYSTNPINPIGSNNPHPTTTRQSEDLQSALMGLLPDLLKHFDLGQLGNNNTMGPSAPPAHLSSLNLDGWAKPQHLAKATNADLFPSHLGGNVLSTSPMDVLSLTSGASVSCKSVDSMSSHCSERSFCRSPGSNRSEDGEENHHHTTTTTNSRVAQASQGMSKGHVKTESEQLCGDSSHMAMQMMEDSLLLNSTSWLESISQLVNEPSAAEMLPSIQELDQQLCRLSMRPSIELPPAGSL